MSIKILIVDDEVAVRLSLAAYLEDFDFEVVTVDSAENALLLFSHEHFEVAIVDLRLPGLSGDQLIHRAHLLDPAVRFLIHTGSVNFTLPQELRVLGMSDRHVINKPQPDLAVFNAIIANMLEESS